MVYNMIINRNKQQAFLIFLIVLYSLPPVSAKGQLPLPRINDYLQPTQQAQMNGFIGEKLDASYQNRILVQDVDRLVSPFQHRTETSCWQTEFWGKWITSAVLAYRYHPEPQLKGILDKAVTDLIATQTSDGYIGNYADSSRLEGWDIWGRKYCMLGLLAYYDLTKDEKVLSAVRKLADNLIKELKEHKALIIEKGSHRGMAASSVLEPVCLLYARTGDKRYLDFAEEIVRQWKLPEGPQLISRADMDVSKRFPKPEDWFGKDQGQKAYEMMSCYEGLLELYRLTGNEKYKTAVEKTWKSIREQEINIVGSGASMECWFGGKELQTQPLMHYQETCVTVTWLKLNQQLLRLTGDAKYADAIERTYYNALLGSMKPDGSDWSKYTPLSGQRMEGSGQCGMGLNCCEANGPRGLFTMPFTAVMTAKDGLQVNFYVDGTYTLKTPGKQTITVTLQTDYPVSGKILIKMSTPRPEKMAVHVRIPEWSRQSSLSVNGQTVDTIVPGQYAGIQQKWNSGDVIELELDMRGRIEHIGKVPEYRAIVRGPVVLARDARLQWPAVDAIIKPVAGKDGYIPLELVGKNQQGIWMQFRAFCIPESYKEESPKPLPVVFCDYASAGNTYDERSFYRVWLPQLIDPGRL